LTARTSEFAAELSGAADLAGGEFQNILEQYWNNGAASRPSLESEKAHVCRPFL
jgi:hypothetical protein